jgi:hypothetical protein
MKIEDLVSVRHRYQHGLLLGDPLSQPSLDHCLTECIDLWKSVVMVLNLHFVVGFAFQLWGLLAIPFELPKQDNSCSNQLVRPFPCSGAKP